MTITQTKFYPLRLAKIFLLFFIITLFFPVRYVFPTSFSFLTGLYSDFTSISLYLSDVFLFIAFTFTLWSNKTQIKEFVNSKPIKMLIIWLLLGMLIKFKSISGLNIWTFIKFIELAVVSYGTVKLLFNYRGLAFKKAFLIIFVSLGTLQSIFGLMQFINQSPIGLNAIGEQVIGPTVWGVAKIACPVACQFIDSTTGVSGGTVYIRAYGTFPHPNVLSAFLIASILINIYLLINKPKFEVSKSLFSNLYSLISIFWLNLALFINILGLTVTFSRGAFLALGIGLLVFFGFLTIKQGFKANSSIILKLLLGFILAFLIFKPFLLTRATVSDQATIERKIYNQTALKIIKDKPLFGLGVGESVLHMKQYSPISLKPWQIQPIHNYFLLSASELGIIGALLLIWVFIGHLLGIWKLIKNFKLKIENNDLWNYRLVLFTILLCFLILMLFDHYFYTLQQTQMLLWIVLGLIATETQPEMTKVASFRGQIKNPQQRG